MIALYTPRVISVVREMRGRLRKPPKSVDDFLNTLHQQGLPQAVGRLGDHSSTHVETHPWARKDQRLQIVGFS